MKISVKGLILIFLAVILVSALSVAGTVAYLSSEVENSGSAGTVGRVEICINEQARVDMTANQYTLVQYENGPIYPTYYSGSSIEWAPADEWVVPNDPAWKVVADNSGVIDKFVTVTNTGTNAAYVRTLIAIEVGENAVVDPYIHAIVNDKNTTSEIGEWKWLDGFYNVNGSTCAVAVVTYLNPVQPGETTVPSLKQVYLDKAVTNEMCESLGDSFDIYVKAQAVQSDNMGDLTAEEALEAAFPSIDPEEVFKN